MGRNEDGGRAAQRKSIALDRAGHHPIRIVAGRARVVWQERVVDEVGRNRFRGGGMDLYQLLLVGKDRVDNRVDKVKRSLFSRLSE